MTTADTSLPRPSSTVWPKISSPIKAFAKLPPSATIGIAMIAVVTLGSLLAPWLTSADPLALSSETLRPPSWAHPMGTDDLGRDLFARVLYGGRVSLMVGVFSAVIGITLGMSFGTDRRLLWWPHRRGADAHHRDVPRSCRAFWSPSSWSRCSARRPSERDHGHRLPGAGRRQRVSCVRVCWSSVRKSS